LKLQCSNNVNFRLLDFINKFFELNLLQVFLENFYSCEY